MIWLICTFKVGHLRGFKHLKEVFNGEQMSRIGVFSLLDFVLKFFDNA